MKSQETSFTEQYRINGKLVQVMAQIYQNEYGAYRAKLEYRQVKINDELDMGIFRKTGHLKRKTAIDLNNPWQTTEIVMNGPGKGKLEKKILDYLRMYVK